MKARKVSHSVCFTDELFTPEKAAEYIPEDARTKHGDEPRFGRWRIVVEFESAEVADG